MVKIFSCYTIIQVGMKAGERDGGNQEGIHTRQWWNGLHGTSRRGKRSLLMFSGVQRFPIAGSFLIPASVCGTCVSSSLAPAEGGAEGMKHYIIMP